MKPAHMLIAFLFFLLSCGEDNDTGPVNNKPTETINWTFEDTPVWSDEFDYTGKPDSAKWGYDIGGHGWGNNELQYYTDDLENASVSDGKLTITAIKEQIEDNEYSSARLVTRNKGDFLYGRFVISAKLPKGVGTWPAIWMLPTDWEYGDWPKSGEIDIMEHVGYDQNKIHITVHTEDYNHTKGTQVGNSKVISNVSEKFHEYRVDWTPRKISGFVDNEQIFEFNNELKGSATWPFDKRFHLLLNIAVGGDWGGIEGVDESAFPTSMEVDYVRVYKLAEEKQ